MLEQNSHDESSSEEGEQFDAAEVREAALRDDHRAVVPLEVLLLQSENVRSEKLWGAGNCEGGCCE